MGGFLAVLSRIPDQEDQKFPPRRGRVEINGSAVAPEPSHGGFMVWIIL